MSFCITGIITWNTHLLLTFSIYHLKIPLLNDHLCKLQCTHFISNIRRNVNSYRNPWHILVIIIRRDFKRVLKFAAILALNFHPEVIIKQSSFFITFNAFLSKFKSLHSDYTRPSFYTVSLQLGSFL